MYIKGETKWEKERKSDVQKTIRKKRKLDGEWERERECVCVCEREREREKLYRWILKSKVNSGGFKILLSFIYLYT